MCVCVCFLRKYRFMGLLEIGLFTGFMWISDLLENSVLNGCLLVLFIYLFNFYVCVFRSGFVFLLFLFKTHLDLN